jgi:hypothetical protein
MLVAGYDDDVPQLFQVAFIVNAQQAMLPTMKKTTTTIGLDIICF